MRLLACVLMAATAAAQEAPGRISGRVLNSLTGAFLPGARVLWTTRDSPSTAAVVADTYGAFVIPNLKPGEYELWAELDDFLTSPYETHAFQRRMQYVTVTT